MDNYLCCQNTVEKNVKNMDYLEQNILPWALEAFMTAELPGKTTPL